MAQNRVRIIDVADALGLPVTMQSMLQASFSIIDQVMIGQLGETDEAYKESIKIMYAGLFGAVVGFIVLIGRI